MTCHAMCHAVQLKVRVGLLPAGAKHGGQLETAWGGSLLSNEPSTLWNAAPCASSRSAAEQMSL
jgi:hypothetical protein